MALCRFEKDLRSELRYLVGAAPLLGVALALEILDLHRIDVDLSDGHLEVFIVVGIE